MVRCVVLGDPIGHSLSPVLHRAAYDALELDWSYQAVQVPAGGLASFLDGLDESWRGLSLTMPLKREAVPLLTSADEWVRRTGAANTIVLDRGRARDGLNTDVPGALAALADPDVGRLSRAVVLGAGATAASLVFALAELGLEHATLLAREPSRAGETLRVLAEHLRGPSYEIRPLDEALEHSVRADIAVSTLPASAQTPELVAAVADVPVLFDVSYDPWPTPLAASAEATDRTLVSGLDLLVAQARLQVCAMTGVSDVPVEAMRSAAEKELRARGAR
jgi:shikimate dehydrogenase